jgi:hypothetical protein
MSGLKLYGAMRYSTFMDVEEKHSRPRLGRKKIILIGIVAVLVLGGVGEALVMYKQAHQSPIPSAVSNQVAFSLYYPSPLPSGWSIDATSYTVNDGIFFYKLHGPSTSVTVTIQARPAAFNPAAFYKSQMQNAPTFDTKNGDGTTATIDKRLRGSMIGSDSLVFLSPDSANITEHELKAIITSLQKS